MDKRVIGNSISWTEKQMDKRVIGNSISWTDRQMDKTQYIMDRQTNGQKTVNYGRTDKWTKG